MNFRWISFVLWKWRLCGPFAAQGSQGSFTEPEFRKHGQKRYDDTALLVAEFMETGYDGDRGRQAIEHMNKIHSVYSIANDDFLFVLSTFIFLPIQWVDSYGWRKTTANERQALFYFFKTVGERMNIKNIPGSLEDFEKFVTGCESQNFTTADTNHAVGNATMNIVKKWMPFFVRPMVLPVMKCLLDRSMLKALGYPSTSSILKVTVYGAMRMRAFFLRKITLKKYPSFVTTEKNRTYPNGYEIHQLGPENLVKRMSNR